MKIKIVKYIWGFLVYLVGFFAWLSVDRAINVSEASTWLIPIIWFIAFFVSLSLSALLFREKIWRIVLAGSFFLSLIFSFSFQHLLFTAISFLLAFWALQRMEGDLEMNKKIDVTKSVRTGKSILVLSLALAISVQYYFEIKGTDKANQIPKFKSGFIAEKVLPELYPNLKSEQNNLTVDEFILEMSRKNSQEFLENKDMGIYEKEAQAILKDNEEMVLEEGRANFSQLTGEDISGQEKVDEVFSDIINNKISEYLSKGVDRHSSLVVSRVAALILFLMVWSLNAFFAPASIIIVFIFFFILRKLGLVKVNKVMAEVEVLE